MNEQNRFEVVVLGIVYDPKTKRILIGRRENDPNISNLRWCFPGGRVSHGEDIDKTLKEKIKFKTGYDVKNLGAIFSRVYPEKKDLLAVYFLCEVFKGKESPKDDLVELKWVSPQEIEPHFKTSFNTRLKEYILNLK